MKLPAIAIVTAFAPGIAIGYWPVLRQAEPSPFLIVACLISAALFLAAAGVFVPRSPLTGVLVPLVALVRVCSFPNWRSCLAYRLAALGISDSQHVLDRSLSALELPHPRPTVVVASRSSQRQSFWHSRFDCRHRFPNG